VNNYLLGKRPPAFDILFWNSDTTRMPAALHADFIDIAMENRLTRPAGHTVLGVPVDLSQVTVDAYVVAGIKDHITPWQNCYGTTRLLGGTSRFVQERSHRRSRQPAGQPVVHLPDRQGQPRRRQAWLRAAESHAGSWWPDFNAWLADRCGALVDAPTLLGGHGLGPLAEAPAPTSSRPERSPAS
jgi:polyhydroxyalkanoate synthase subunit PhaC